MGGVSIFAWIAIGAIASWTVTRLMVRAEDDALRGTAAGVIGAVLGGLGMRFSQSGSEIVSGGLNALVGALAGSLWLTWITCVATSGREQRREPPSPAKPQLSSTAAAAILGTSVTPLQIPGLVADFPPDERLR